MVGSDYVGDDLAQLWIDGNGILRAVNPEIGIFGIVEDLNKEGDPYLYKCLREPGTEVIWSNVLVDYHSVPHWSGSGEPLPAKGRNFQGEWWPGKTDQKGKPVPLSNPNARVTLTNDAIGNFNRQAAWDPAGVPDQGDHVQRKGQRHHASGLGGEKPRPWRRDRSLHPLCRNGHRGGRKGGEQAAVGKLPLHSLPARGLHGSAVPVLQLEKFSRGGRPLIAGLNYFLVDCARGGDLNKLLGEKRDVRAWLSWLERYAHGEVGAIETPIGFIPRYEDLAAIFDQTIGQGISERELYDKQFSFYMDNILARISLQEEAYRKDNRMPPRLFEVYEEQRRGLEALKRAHGHIVPPDKL